MSTPQEAALARKKARDHYQTLLKERGAKFSVSKERVAEAKSKPIDSSAFRSNPHQRNPYGYAKKPLNN